MMMTIGQFAQSTGLSAKALRLYDEIGLLTPSEVNPSTGYRRYRRAQIRRGAQLAVLRRMGVPLELAGQLLDDPDRAEERLDAHTRQVRARHAAELAAISSGRALLAGYDQPGELQRRHATAQPWVGATLTFPSDPQAAAVDPSGVSDEAANAAFGTLHHALVQAGVEVTGPWWTTLTISEDGCSIQIVLCWPVAGLPEATFAVPGLQVTMGVLPERYEALVQVRHAVGDDSAVGGDDHIMGGVPVAAAVHLEEQLTDSDESVDGQVRQVGLLDANGGPVGIELVVTTAIITEQPGN